VQGALVEFVNESGLRAAFESKELAMTKGLSASKTDFIQKVAITDGPMREAFPAKIVTGPLARRIEEFAAKFPYNVKIIDDVTFEFPGRKAKRKVLAISIHGLDAKQQKQLKLEYLKYFSSDLLSFPMEEQGGHLLSRMGKKNFSYGFSSSVDSSDYALLDLYSNPRIETMIQLTPEEFLNARAYMDNAVTNPSETVGGFVYEGVAKRIRRPTLTANRPTSGGHNCTSWVCTAPIGADGQTIHELSGATAQQEMHTNPGWWTSWLSSGAKPERVPAVVYFTKEPLESDVAARIVKGKMRWDFGRR